MSLSRSRALDQALSAEACPIAQVLDHVAGKWSVGIIVAAAHGPVRFTELERSITGISRRMLTLTLRKLERDGLLRRTVYPTVPPRVEYTLTDMARELRDSFTTLVSWAERHRGAIAAAQAAYDTAAQAACDTAAQAACDTAAQAAGDTAAQGAGEAEQRQAGTASRSGRSGAAISAAVSAVPPKGRQSMN